MRVSVWIFASIAFTLGCGSGKATQPSQPSVTQRPKTAPPIVDEAFRGRLGTLLFVTQVPIGGLGSVVGSFNNHLPGIASATRGGDLMIQYPDGSLRNLTREAGFGSSEEFQGKNAIAVREPTVHWNGNRAVFSMVIGAPPKQYERPRARWQLYEVSGLAKGEKVVIERVLGQPEDYNNVSPIYGSDDAILFTSDRPRKGQAHHYPPLDEYESMETNIGIYRLHAGREYLELIEHSPSGAFNLSLDSHGRVLFTKWDHLQRDQQADGAEAVASFSPITHADESKGAKTTRRVAKSEVFPEVRDKVDPEYDSHLAPHRFNHFFVWEVNQDGSEEETLNHVGRQEWGGSNTEGSFRRDSSLAYRAGDTKTKNRVELPDDGGAFQVRQDSANPSWYLAAVAPEFATGCSGYLATLEGDPEVNPEDMRVIALTATQDGESALGHFRNPLRLSDGSLIAVHTAAEGNLENTGSVEAPRWSYDFRIKTLDAAGQGFVPGAMLTEGIPREVSWYTPDQKAKWSGVLWELDPVEVAPRPRPPMRASKLPSPEEKVFAQAGVDPSAFKAWMQERELALLVSRNVTARDRNDVQQPYRLAVPGGVSSKAGKAGYDVSHVQFFEADYVRSYAASNRPGRRPLARAIHGPDLRNDPAGPPGSVAIGKDGSMAALVPARRALSWQLVSPKQEGIVRERNWISFASGEIRVCAACHGVNKATREGKGIPDNEPAALLKLLKSWKSR